MMRKTGGIKIAGVHNPAFAATMPRTALSEII
jgi:hypothetical protein